MSEEAKQVESPEPSIHNIKRKAGRPKGSKNKKSKAPKSKAESDPKPKSKSQLKRMNAQVTGGLEAKNKEGKTIRPGVEGVLVTNPANYIDPDPEKAYKFCESRVEFAARNRLAGWTPVVDKDGKIVKVGNSVLCSLPRDRREEIMAERIKVNEEYGHKNSPDRIKEQNPEQVSGGVQSRWI